MSDDLPTIAPYVSHSPEAEAASLPSETPTHYKTDEDRRIAHMENDIAAAQKRELPHPDIPSEARLHSEEVDRELAAVFDKAHEREERNAKKNPEMPPMPEGKTGEDYMHALGEWMDKPLAERQRIAAAHTDLDERRKDAERFGLTLAEAEALKQTAALREQPAAPSYYEWREAETGFKSIFPDQSPQQTAKWLTDVVQFARRDPNAAIPWIAQQLGLGQQVALANQPAPALDSDEAMTSAAKDFFSHHADARPHVVEMIEAVKTGNIQYEPGNYFQLFAKAYDKVKKSGREKPRGKVDAEMEAIYNRMAG